VGDGTMDDHEVFAYLQEGGPCVPDQPGRLCEASCGAQARARAAAGDPLRHGPWDDLHEVISEGLHCVPRQSGSDP
jgi:hypothetical protein